MCFRLCSSLNSCAPLLDRALPAMYPYTIQVAEAGGLMAYDIDYPDLEGRAATYVDKIFKGAKPFDLPIQQPTKFAQPSGGQGARINDFGIFSRPRRPTYRITVWANVPDGCRLCCRQRREKAARTVDVLRQDIGHALPHASRGRKEP
jgi:hypothetical protein